MYANRKVFILGTQFPVDFFVFYRNDTFTWWRWQQQTTMTTTMTTMNACARAIRDFNFTLSSIVQCEHKHIMYPLRPLSDQLLWIHSFRTVFFPLSFALSLCHSIASRFIIILPLLLCLCVRIHRCHGKAVFYCLQAIFSAPSVHCFSCFHVIIFQSTNTQEHLDHHKAFTHTRNKKPPHSQAIYHNELGYIFFFRYNESELNFQFEQNHHIWSWKATVETKRNHITKSERRRRDETCWHLNVFSTLSLSLSVTQSLAHSPFISYETNIRLFTIYSICWFWSTFRSVTSCEPTSISLILHIEAHESQEMMTPNSGNDWPEIKVKRKKWSKKHLWMGQIKLHSSYWVYVFIMFGQDLVQVSIERMCDRNDSMGSFQLSLQCE